MAKPTSPTHAKKRRVAVVGGGRFAYGALGMVRAANAGGAGYDVVGWARSDAAKAMIKDRGAVVADSVTAAVSGADIVIVAVPAGSIAEVAGIAAAAASGDQVVVHAARGVGAGFALPHELLRGATCWKKIVAIGGPLYLDDAGTGRALNAAIGSRFDEAIDAVRALLRGAPIRLSATHDVKGLELCGAMSNVGHLAVGLAAGAGLGETDQGLLHVRALLEAGRLGRAIGAERATFSGLAGVGDLIPRRVSSQRKHRDVGHAVASGGDADNDVTALEGAITAREGALWAERHHVDAPLLHAVASILDGGKAAGPTLLSVLDTELGLQAA
jgi:glycerol-3-phosphate dehydrogenase (NAD(P)+)